MAQAQVTRFSALLWSGSPLECFAAGHAGVLVRVAPGSTGLLHLVVSVLWCFVVPCMKQERLLGGKVLEFCTCCCSHSCAAMTVHGLAALGLPSNCDITDFASCMSCMTIPTDSLAYQGGTGTGTQLHNCY